ncbi:MAG: 4Fe-4S binding protein [Nitrospirae bacterium]|nr:4Fe-4S binding protein [Nitrospirota bacterium]
MYIAVVNWDKCTGCGDCVTACPIKCFEMSDGKCLPHRAAECIDCGNCPEICPSDAIAIAIGWGG